MAPDADGFVGYRVRERLGSISAPAEASLAEVEAVQPAPVLSGRASAPNDVVGRSPGVSGTVTIAGGTVTGAEVTVDMTRLRTDVEPRDGRMREEGLETDRFPTASFRLREPVPLPDVSGARVVELRLPGTLTLHGVTRPLDFPVQARWDGDSIQVAGGTRIRRADFDLEVPTLAGYRIEDTAVVELELTLVRRGAALAGPVSTLRRATAVPQPGGEEPGRPQGEPCRGGGRLPEGGGRLLFSAITDDDTEHLFTIGADGRGLRRVGDDDASELDPAWSPDGRRIAYARAEPFQFSPPPSVHLARPDGSGRRDLTPGQPSFQPDWSPDGRRIAITVTGAMETTEISILDLQGSPVALFDDTPTSDSEPRWSPDGRRLSFVRDGNLFVTRPDGSGAACVRTGMLLTSGARWQPTP